MKGKQIRARREKLGMTQAQLADSLGIASNTVARWEREERHPPGRFLELAFILIESDPSYRSS